MSMADDNTRRSYRSNDPYRRNANPADAQDTALGGTDPLAELARLIGQSDPFTDTVRRQPQAAAPRADQYAQERRAATGAGTSSVRITRRARSRRSTPTRATPRPIRTPATPTMILTG